MPRVPNIVLRSKIALALSPAKTNRQLQRYVQEIQDLSYSYQLTIDERISVLERKANPYKAMDDDSQSKEIYKLCMTAILKAKREKENEKTRIEALAEKGRLKMQKNLQLCIDYALLDAQPALHVSDRGLSEGESIQFYLSLLESFDEKHPSTEVKQLISAFKNLFVLLCCCDDSDEPFSLSDRLILPFQTYKRNLFAQLQALELMKTPYVLLPVATVDHAMAAKIDFFEGEGYVLTLINTGHGAITYGPGQTCEKIYPRLTHEEIFLIGSLLFTRSNTVEALYSRIANALPVEKQLFFPGRIFTEQKGDSCACQCLSTLIHGILPEPIYWAFKAFATEKMIENIPQGPRLEAAQQLLIKRTNKMKRRSS